MPTQEFLRQSAVRAQQASARDMAGKDAEIERLRSERNRLRQALHTMIQLHENGAAPISTKTIVREAIEVLAQTDPT